MSDKKTRLSLTNLNQGVRNVAVDLLRRGLCEVGAVEGEHLGRSLMIRGVRYYAGSSFAVHVQHTLAAQVVLALVHWTTSHYDLHALRHDAGAMNCLNIIF